MKPEARGWRLEAGSWRLEAGNWRLEAGDWRPEAGGRKPEASGWRPKARKQRSKTGDWRLGSNLVKAVLAFFASVSAAVLLEILRACGPDGLAARQKPQNAFTFNDCLQEAQLERR